MSKIEVLIVTNESLVFKNAELFDTSKKISLVQIRTVQSPICSKPDKHLDVFINLKIFF
jgi:hypothetical protein